MMLHGLVVVLIIRSVDRQATVSSLTKIAIVAVAVSVISLLGEAEAGARRTVVALVVPATCGIVAMHINVSSKRLTPGALCLYAVGALWLYPYFRYFVGENITIQAIIDAPRDTLGEVFELAVRLDTGVDYWESGGGLRPGPGELMCQMVDAFQRGQRGGGGQIILVSRLLATPALTTSARKEEIVIDEWLFCEVGLSATRFRVGVADLVTSPLNLLVWDFGIGGAVAAGLLYVVGIFITLKAGTLRLSGGGIIAVCGALFALATSFEGTLATIFSALRNAAAITGLLAAVAPVRRLLGLQRC